MVEIHIHIHNLLEEVVLNAHSHGMLLLPMILNCYSNHMVLLKLNFGQFHQAFNIPKIHNFASLNKMNVCAR